MIVDKIINFWVDLVTPGSGVGESNLLMRTFRTMEQSSQRASTELDIRQNLREWDHGHPQIHHELIVRYLCGAVVSVVATSFYNTIMKRDNRRHSSY
jgi:hypothetical protein